MNDKQYKAIIEAIDSKMSAQVGTPQHSNKQIITNKAITILLKYYEIQSLFLTFLGLCFGFQ